jgi:TetR/AcrR family transcriptional repressor of nem operon
MKVTREQAQQNRERVVETAARLFREHGFEGVGVAQLMQQAGLTHGGFYGQFGSKEALMAEACERAFERSAQRWQQALQAHANAPLRALARFYLAPAHRDDPGNGCVAAALATEAARQGPAVRRVLTEGVQRLAALLARALPGRGPKARRRRALGSFAAMVGAVVLARAVDDPAMSDEILAATAELLDDVAAAG